VYIDIGYILIIGLNLGEQQTGFPHQSNFPLIVREVAAEQNNSHRMALQEVEAVTSHSQVHTHSPSREAVAVAVAAEKEAVETAD
jgi:hypothetical protein